mmetsp:Transcript_7916/g.17364  ORF Transcript_7916/g.17364 Transcript_7916/m.17364 type:complete len:107 (-) Transcript_7916:92-412(-)|eukprot:CAMPEP_0183353720 /NCGR_PEP_ID=MMETSP0164_2-20130417/34658_1 /TAXON_ID=221442 /ORGANISM="Coccolithus pelagicus ssp braarudi, Strain PLY182g" /LENGTH=106 /DNA_ID=CAMNT_0025526449 /DNA_START=57 /DNA_END=377 /DNA_ORIENTATION=-
MAGHEPAVKAGGRRVGKPVPHAKPAAKDAAVPKSASVEALEPQPEVKDVVASGAAPKDLSKETIEKNPKAIPSTYHPPPKPKAVDQHKNSQINQSVKQPGRRGLQH